MEFVFGDIVVVEEKLIGVVLKYYWTNKTYDVYVRMTDTIQKYKESEMERYMVRHKFLTNEEILYQKNAINS